MTPTIIITLPLTLMLFPIMMLIRCNHVVGPARQKAINLAHQCSKRIIASHQWDKWRKAWDVEESYPSFDQMMWNLKAWSFNQLYPCLEARLAELEGEVSLAS